jgi:dephospho-CoA kinase
LPVKPGSRSARLRRSRLRSSLSEVNIRRSIVLYLSDEDLFELERIMLDNDGEGALKVLKKYLEHEVNAVISGEGH